MAPPALIESSVHKEARTVVFPVPASPISTDILDSANTFKSAAFSVRALSSSSVALNQKSLTLKEFIKNRSPICIDAYFRSPKPPTNTLFYNLIKSFILTIL